MKNYFIYAFLFVFFLSCSSDDFMSTKENQELGKSKSSDVFSFIYHDKEFSSLSEVDSSGNIFIFDKSVKEVFDSLINKDSIAILVGNNSSVYFFDSSLERDRFLNSDSYILGANWSSKSTSYVYIHDMDIKLYDKDKGRKNGGPYLLIGTIRDPNRTTVPVDLNIPNMSSVFYDPFKYSGPGNGFNFDNRISSFEIWGTFYNLPAPAAANGRDHVSVTFYDGYNYQGRSLSFTDIFPGKTYSTRDYMNSFNFNNITSSMKVRYHYYGQ